MSWPEAVVYTAGAATFAVTMWALFKYGVGGSRSRVVEYRDSPQRDEWTVVETTEYDDE